LLVIYTVGLSSAIYLGFMKLNELFQNAVLEASGGQAAIDSTALELLLLGFRSTLTLLCLPLFLTAIALPIQVLWIQGSLRNVRLITDMLPSMKASLRTLALMVRLELRYLLPLLLMIGLYVPFIRDSSQVAVARLFSFALATVILVTIYRALPGLLSPLLAILGEFQGRDAVIYSESILRAKRSQLLFISVSTIALVLLLYLAWHGTTIASLSAISVLELSGYLFVLWYALVLICAEILDALREFPQFQPTA
jgi:hypothetical protein